jgi:Zn-finger nucleic acid-binding protein
MKCPVDGTDLLMAERQGGEIDYCPKCRGIWLDRGELDKIVDRSAAEARHTPPQRPIPQQPAQQQGYDSKSYRDKSYREDRGRKYDHDDKYYRRKRRKSWLEDILDFD